VKKTSARKKSKKKSIRRRKVSVKRQSHRKQSHRKIYGGSDYKDKNTSTTLRNIIISISNINNEIDAIELGMYLDLLIMSDEDISDLIEKNKIDQYIPDKNDLENNLSLIEHRYSEKNNLIKEKNKLIKTRFNELNIPDKERLNNAFNRFNDIFGYKRE
jgi:hypothetical protein